MILHPNPFERCIECIFILKYTILASSYLFSSPLFSSQDEGMHGCIYSCSPLNVVDLIVDIMFIIDILINFRSEL